MSEVLVTARMMRKAVRGKIRAGARPKMICLIINQYAPSGLSVRRWEEGIPRLPVELVPYGRRSDFLDELAELPLAAVR